MYTEAQDKISSFRVLQSQSIGLFTLFCLHTHSLPPSLNCVTTQTKDGIEKDSTVTDKLFISRVTKFYTICVSEDY